MKKLIAFVLLISVMIVSLFGCGGTPKCFTGEWKFSAINSVELKSDLDQSVIDLLKEEYSAENEEEIKTNALDRFVAEEVFTPCYIKFGKETYTYDPVLVREATWAFYQLTENEGFLSFYTGLDVANGNPDPILYPDVAYNAETNTMFLTINYTAFMVTLELVR